MNVANWTQPGRTLLVTVCASACMSMPARDRTAPRMCAFTVTNQTLWAVDVRLTTRPAEAVSIGMLNPGELLNHDAPCPALIRVRGYPLPMQAGMPPAFHYAEDWAELQEGQRARITLSFP